MRLRTEVVAVDTEDARVLLDERTGRYFQLNRSRALILDAVLADADEAECLTRSTLSAWRPPPTRRPPDSSARPDWWSRERACERTIRHSSAANAADERQRGGGVSQALHRGDRPPRGPSRRRPPRRRRRPDAGPPAARANPAGARAAQARSRCRHTGAGPRRPPGRRRGQRPLLGPVLPAALPRDGARVPDPRCLAHLVHRRAHTAVRRARLGRGRRPTRRRAGRHRLLRPLMTVPPVSGPPGGLAGRSCDAPVVPSQGSRGPIPTDYVTAASSDDRCVTQGAPQPT